MMDETINDPLKQLDADLDVAPSPEFAAKVRMRLDGDAMPSRWTIRWVLVGVSAAVVIALIAGAWPSAKLGPATGVVAINTEITADARAAEIAPSPPPASRRTTPARVSTPARPVVRFGNVLVPPDQANALDALLAGVRSGRLAVPAEPDPLVELPELKVREIPPVRIEPLPDLTDTEGSD